MGIKNIYKGINSYLFFRQSQNWSKDRLRSYQDQKLIALIRHAAKNVPYYRDIFPKIGFDPASFSGTVDMHKFPLLDKDTVRTKKKEFIADNAKKFGINYDSTSGSTGTPLEVIISDESRIKKICIILRSNAWAGHRIGQSAFGIQNYIRFSFPPNKIIVHNKLFNVYRFNAVKLNRDTAIQCAKELFTIKPKLYMGFPLSLVMLAKYATEAGIPLHQPKAIVTLGETLTDYRREYLEKVYKSKVYDFYSIIEAAVIISECEFCSKHWMDDFSYNEVINEEGENIKDGIGELVGTNLYNYAMPLIRYKTRDFVEISSAKQSCKCGRNFGVIDKITGRINDYIFTPDGRIFSNTLEHVIDNAVGVSLSQCVQDTPDHIYLNLVVEESFNKNSFNVIESALRKRMGPDMKINFKIVKNLEKNRSGKTPFVLSKIGNEFS